METVQSTIIKAAVIEDMREIREGLRLCLTGAPCPTIRAVVRIVLIKLAQKRHWEVGCPTGSLLKSPVRQSREKAERITYRFTVDGFDAQLAAVKASKLGIGITSSPPEPPECKGLGHKNTLGLTPLGHKALQIMMKRGMLIDVDHMSLLSVESALEQAEAVPGGYPLVSGHNSLRVEAGNENSRTSDQLVRLGQLGGMFGLGSDGVKSTDYLDYYTRASQRIGPGRVAFGTDLNGLVKGPMPRLVVQLLKPETLNLKDCLEIYDAAFVKSKTGDRIWNYCIAGVAHYGMLADFLKDIYSMPQGDYVNKHIMENAEIFAQMWEKALANGKGA